VKIDGMCQSRHQPGTAAGKTTTTYTRHNRKKERFSITKKKKTRILYIIYLQATKKYETHGA